MINPSRSEIGRIRTKHDVPGTDKDDIKDIDTWDLKDPGHERETDLSVVINEDEQLIVRKQLKQGRQGGAILLFRVEQHNARIGRAYTRRKETFVLNLLAHGHQPSGVDGWTPRKGL